MCLDQDDSSDHHNHGDDVDCGCVEKEQEAKLAKEQKRMEQQWQVSKVLLDGLYDSSCNLSLLRETPNIMKEIWQQLLHMVDNLDLNHYYQSAM